MTEIRNGLEKDIHDVKVNTQGHLDGLAASKYWRQVIDNQEVSFDSIQQHFLNLTRDFISIQNVSGYEALKSKGLEIIRDDSLRYKIIALYEYDYTTLKKLEEDYQELQFQRSYFQQINQLLAKNFEYAKDGQIVAVNLPLQLTEEEKKLLLSYLWKIDVNRAFILRFYDGVEDKIDALMQEIEKEIGN